MKGKFLNYLFWLVIAAAFIGPGTVTTAASAGASFQYQLIWAMIFSTGACLVLQEAAARVAIVTGQSLGAAIRKRFKTGKVAWLIGISILLGCLAYEAGNILGAISGLALIVTEIPSWIFTLAIGITAFAVLYIGKSSTVANLLGVLVGVMGLAFFIAAISSPIDATAFFRGAVTPSIPNDAILVTLGLIGTTIVPYNIFLGSSLAEGQSLKSMRSGLTASVLMGGAISVCVIIVGAQLSGPFNFKALFDLLKEQNGSVMAWLFAIGLFAAGFTSTITASMAGALTIKSVHSQGANWNEKTNNYRRLWMMILIIGVAVGVSGVKPIPVIILAQAANGLILPLLTFVIWVIINSDQMSDQKNGLLANIFMAVTLAVSTILGLLNVLKATYSALGEPFELQSLHLMALGFVASLVILWALYKMRTKGSF